VLDSRRCISYLTIELRGSIPVELRGPMGEWVFGCDICQEVCPWNRKAPTTTEPGLQAHPDLEAMDLIEILSLSEEDFRQRFRGTALTRPRRRGLLRNAAIILGNQGDHKALPALQRARMDAEALVREAAEWAIQEILHRAHLQPPDDAQPIGINVSPGTGTTHPSGTSSDLPPPIRHD
jgi:epoxyqueuosine reductase